MMMEPKFQNHKRLTLIRIFSVGKRTMYDFHTLYEKVVKYKMKYRPPAPKLENKRMRIKYVLKRHSNVCEFSLLTGWVDAKDHSRYKESIFRFLSQNLYIPDE